MIKTDKSSRCYSPSDIRRPGSSLRKRKHMADAVHEREVLIDENDFPVSTHKA